MSAPDNTRYQIQAAPFEPSDAPVTSRRWSVSQALLLLATAVALMLLWFLFTAKSVRLEFSTPTQSIDLRGGFVLSLGDVFLLRQGEYQLVVEADKYDTLSTQIQVNADRNQQFFFELVPNPGVLKLQVEPSSASLRVDGEDVVTEAQTSPHLLTLAAGPHTLEFSHPRYQTLVEEIDIQGLGQEQELSVTLPANWSNVTVRSQPPEAAIFIDGEATGIETPGTVEALAGERLIELRLPGFRTHQQRLLSAAGETIALAPVNLIQADAQLSLTSSPTGAAVTLDGQYVGKTPIELDLASRANQQLLVLAKGYAAHRQPLNLPSGSISKQNITLERLEGTLTIETRPPEARVRIDGVEVSTSAGVERLRLPVQSHQVDIDLVGYAGFTTTIDPLPGLDQQLRVQLLTLEQARLAALQPEIETRFGHLLRLQDADQVNMGASRREPGRRANETLRTATFERLFYLADREVTNAQFRAFAKGHDSGSFEDLSLDEDDQPVTGVSWHEAAAYCNWLSEQESLAPVYQMEFGKVIGSDPGALGYRLPTEAEWAWAARRLPPNLSADGDHLRFAWGETLPPPERFENYADRSAANMIGRVIFGYNDNYAAVAPVASYAASHKGLYDMGGNVAEWMHDFYEIPTEDPVLDHVGPSSGEYHVIRGASWMHGTITELRLSFRDYGIEGRQDLGFRVARYAER